MKIDAFIGNFVGESAKKAAEIIEIGMLLSDNITVAASNDWIYSDTKINNKKLLRAAAVEYGLKELKEFESSDGKVDSCILTLQRWCTNTSYSKIVRGRVVESWQAEGITDDEVALNKTKLALVSKFRQYHSFKENVICNAFGIKNTDEFRGAALMLMYKVNGNRSIKGIGVNEIPKGKEHILKWKVVCDSKLHLADDENERSRILESIEVVGPNVVVSDDYCLIGVCNTRAEAEHIAKYVKTRIVRKAIEIAVRNTGKCNPELFKYVPKQDFSDTSEIYWGADVSQIEVWLIRKYGITETELESIAKTIEPYI